jgi:AraC family transcriptional regulator of arabinose operon
MPNLSEESYPFWPEYVKAGSVNYPPGGTLGPRIQPTIEFVMLHDGDMTVYLDGNPHFASSKTITILFPGHTEHFVFSKETNTNHSYVHIAFPLLPQSFNERLHRLPRSIPISRRMASFSSELMTLSSSSLLTRDVMLKLQAVTIFWLFVGEAELLGINNSSPPQKNIVETACRYMIANLSEDISLDTIAEAASVCPEYLIRVFNNKINTTPISYLWERRVSLGIDLLEHSGLSISLIAERCGFKTRNHFSRKIFETTGHSPKEVRQKAWQKSSSN